MLTYMRPARSPTEAAFVARFVAPLGAKPDGYGNYWLTIGRSPILWSCHTDTVHKAHGKQRVEYGDGYATTPDGSCLGADCAAGVWLMAHMIRAGVPGTYVFHREEETGGQGSEYVQMHEPDRLDGIAFAIAFDRKGTQDIVTEQYCGRTASDRFAASLADALGASYMPVHGTFTDTANYASVVPECSNISVGYDKAHSKREYLDVAYLTALLDKIKRADFSTLVVDRDPADDQYPTATDDGLDWATADDGLDDLVWQHPGMAADFMRCCGFTAHDLADFINDAKK
jgi:acetylornithine deacetylase/succinyl-diaminopimelate desuccinylase-like protein